MKNSLVVGIMAACLAFAASAEAAKPKRNRQQSSRVGAYAGVFIGQGNYSDDQSNLEAELFAALLRTGATPINPRVETQTADLGYQAAFGYRFTRYFAAELGIADYGELSSKGSAEFDEGAGPFPVSIKVAFNVQGPVMSGVAILPLGEKFELYGRAGILFASSKRSVATRVDGQAGPLGEAKGDSQEMVLGIGASYNIGQVYAIRAEYQRLGSLGQENRTGTEELSCASLGFIMRF